MYIYICTLYIYSGDGHESHGKREIPVGNHYLSNFKSSTLRCTSIAQLIYTVLSFFGHVSCCTRPKMSNLCMLLICSNWQAFLLHVISVARCRHQSCVSSFLQSTSSIHWRFHKNEETPLDVSEPPATLAGCRMEDEGCLLLTEAWIESLEGFCKCTDKNTLTCPPFVSNSQ